MSGKKSRVGHDHQDKTNRKSHDKELNNYKAEQL